MATVLQWVYCGKSVIRCFDGEQKIKKKTGQKCQESKQWFHFEGDIFSRWHLILAHVLTFQQRTFCIMITTITSWQLKNILSLSPVSFTWTPLPLLSLWTLCPSCFTCFLCAITPDSNEQLLIIQYQDQDIGIRCVGAEKHLKHAGAGCPRQERLVGDKRAKHMTPNHMCKTLTGLHNFKPTCFPLWWSAQSYFLVFFPFWRMLPVFFCAEPWLNPLSLQ